MLMLFLFSITIFCSKWSNNQVNKLVQDIQHVFEVFVQKITTKIGQELAPAWGQFFSLCQQKSHVALWSKKQSIFGQSCLFARYGFTWHVGIPWIQKKSYLLNNFSTKIRWKEVVRGSKNRGYKKAFKLLFLLKSSWFFWLTM